MDPTFTYSPGSGQQRDQLRLLIPDRPNPARATPAMFSDQELGEFLTMGADVFNAAAMACEVVAMDEAKRAISVSITSGMSISRSSTPSFWLNRAKQLRDAAAKVPWEFVDSMSYHIDAYGQDRSSYIGDIDDE